MYRSRVASFDGAGSRSDHLVRGWIGAFDLVSRKAMMQGLQRLAICSAIRSSVLRQPFPVLVGRRHRCDPRH